MGVRQQSTAFTNFHSTLRKTVPGPGRSSATMALSKPEVTPPCALWWRQTSGAPLELHDRAKPHSQSDSRRGPYTLILHCSYLWILASDRPARRAPGLSTFEILDLAAFVGAVNRSKIADVICPGRPLMTMMWSASRTASSISWVTKNRVSDRFAHSCIMLLL